MGEWGMGNGKWSQLTRLRLLDKPWSIKALVWPGGCSNIIHMICIFGLINYLGNYISYKLDSNRTWRSTLSKITNDQVSTLRGKEEPFDPSRLGEQAYPHINTNNTTLLTMSQFKQTFRRAARPAYPNTDCILHLASRPETLKAPSRLPLRQTDRFITSECLIWYNLEGTPLTVNAGFRNGWVGMRCPR